MSTARRMFEETPCPSTGPPTIEFLPALFARLFRHSGLAERLGLPDRVREGSFSGLVWPDTGGFVSFLEEPAPRAVTWLLVDPFGQHAPLAGAADPPFAVEAFQTALGALSRALAGADVRPLTPAAFRHLAETCELRLEWNDGRVFAMAGGTPEHARLGTRLVLLLSPQLQGGQCEVFNLDLQIRAAGWLVHRQADATIVCGALARHPDDPASVMNPRVVFEVVSATSRQRDHVTKAKLYLEFASVEFYVIVEGSRRELTVCTRTDRGWQRRVYLAGETARFDSLVLPLDELYRGIALG